MCFCRDCKTAVNFADFVLKVDRILMDNRSKLKAHDYIVTLALLFDDGATPEYAVGKIVTRLAA